MKYYNLADKQQLDDVLLQVSRCFLKYAIMTKETTDKKQLERIYKDYEKQIYNIFERFRISFFKRYNINENEIEYTLNYNVGVKEFYNQLIELKEQYNESKNSLYKPVEKITDDSVNSQIKLLYYTRFRKVEYFLNSSKSQKNPNILQIKTLFEEYYMHFVMGADLSYVEKCLSSLEKLVFNQLETDELEYQSTLIHSHIQDIMNKYINVLNNLVFPQDIEKASVISNKFSQILEYIQLADSKMYSLETLNILFDSTFLDFEDDKEKIDQLEEFSNDKSDIYVINKNANIYPDMLVGKIISSKDCYLILKGIDKDGEIKEFILNKQQFLKLYISLEEFLNNSHFSGNCYDSNLNKIILYYNNFISIIYDKKLNELSFVPRVLNQKENLVSRKNDSVIEQFKNKMYIKKAINDWISNMVSKKKVKKR